MYISFILIMQKLHEENIVNAYSTYEKKIPAIVSKGNIFGMQFHPEKSGEAGMKLLKNFGGIMVMKIFPAIDLKNGKCVRLYQGEFSSSQIVGEDPLQTALKFVAQGAEYLHMVDLDGALSGTIENVNSINKVIKDIKIPIQLGGGIRSLDTIEMLIKKGLNRVILGTAALNNPSLVKEAVKKFGDKIAIGIDARDGYVAVEGWQTSSKIEYIDFAKQMEDIGVKTIIFTDISRDGTLTGPNFEATGKINDKVSCNIIASGGMKCIEDIKKLKNMNIYGAIIGKALYSGNISLEEAIREGRGFTNAY